MKLSHWLYCLVLGRLLHQIQCFESVLGVLGITISYHPPIGPVWGARN